VPIGDCCHDPGDCLVGPHAATGWCLAATGAPVLVITTLACPGDGSVSVSLIDPSTGDPVPAQAIVSCENKDWEVNQLCDYDVDTGELIATFIQIFEWSEDTEILVVTNVRADNPAVVYVPTGQVRACSTDQTVTDVEVTEFCYATEGPIGHGWQAWIFLDGVHVANIYYDALGVVIVDPTVVDCPPLATEATLLEVLLAIGDSDLDLTELLACCQAGNLILEAIDGNTDNIETLLTLIQGNVDGLEACCAATNVLLTAIDGHVDGIEGLITTTNTILTTIDGHVDDLEACCAASNVLLSAINTNTDGLEACCAASNALLTLIHGDVDGVEALLTLINGNVDGLEACCAAGNVLLTAIDGHVDGLEACCAASNVILSSIDGHVDGLEACCAASNVLLTAIDGHVDGIETLLTTIDSHVDGLESCCAAGNVLLAAIDGHVDGIEGFLATLVTSVHNEDSPHVSGDGGVAVWGVRNDAAAVLTSANGDYSPIATDSAGRVGIADLGGSITVDGTLNATIAPQTSGGLSIYRNLDLNATGINIKASAGQLYSMVVVNRSNTESFLKFYNKASAPVVGTDTPVMTIPLDAKNGGGQASTVIETSLGLEFSLGIGIACTTGLADASVATPAVNSIVANIGYK